MNFTELDLINLYPGTTPTQFNLQTTGGVMTRAGGFADYLDCLTWLDTNVSKTDGFLEIGSGWGGSFHLWASMIQEGPKISIDYLDVEHYSFMSKTMLDERHNRWSSHFNSVISIEGDSNNESTVEMVKTALAGKKVGWLFIDGDHSFPNFIVDFLKYSKFVIPGGFIGFHDVADGFDSGDIKNVGGFFNTLRNKVFVSRIGDGIGVIQI